MENRRRSRLLKTLGLLGLTAGVALALHVTTDRRLWAAGAQHVTKSPVYWNWDPVTPSDAGS